MNIKRYIKILQLLFWILFSGFILLPAMNSCIHFIKENKGNENRTKSPKPDFDLTNLDSYVKKFDTYYTDNFSLRENYIELHNKFEYFILGVSPVPDEVVVGKNGWFYDKNCTPNYKGTNIFTEQEMAKLKDELAFRTKWAAERGIKYYLAVVPSKMNIYPEYLPSKIIKESDITRYDQIISLNNEPEINVIDIRKNLISHKKEGYDLYQHTDGHWNDLGAYYGYQEIMNRLSKDFPDLQPFPLSDYTIDIEKRSGGSIVSMINLEKEYPEQYVKLTEKNKVYAHDGKKRDYEAPKTIPAWEHQIIKVNDNGKKLKCLVIRDSFTLLMIRYLQEHFKETVFIHDEWKYRMREDLILKEKPDIVINIVFETGLDKLIEFPFSKSVTK
jgi:alginate O-acetyltransferase complex protein AlgJ